MMQKPAGAPQRRTFVIAIILLAAALALGLASLFLIRDQTPSGTGKALVGGPFTMINQKGETVTEKDFAGKYMLVFFGFTFCPDVCPTELQVMGAALDQLGPDADKITPVFVSVDPERDTVSVVVDYISNFRPGFVGLTGSMDQVKAMAKTYRVYFAKVENKERPADYQVDHSSIIYLMGPDGSFVKHFSYTTDPKAMADSLRQAIAN